MMPPQTTVREALTLWERAGQSVVDDGPWAAAAVFVFILSALTIRWFFKSMREDINEARAGERGANAASLQLSEKSVEVNTQLRERIDRVITMLNRLLDMDSGRRRRADP